MNDTMLKLLAQAGTVCALAFGVAAAVAGAVAGFAGLELSRRSDLAVAAAGRQAAEANETSILAQRDVANARRDAAAAQQQTEQLKGQNLNLERRLEAERTERLQLEARLRSRSLGSDQVFRLSRSLHGLQALQVQIVRLGDMEARQYADQLVRLLHQAGVSVGIMDIGVMSPPVYGVHVDGPEAVRLAAALKRAGVDVVLESRPGPQTRIVVGLKPPAI